MALILIGIIMGLLTFIGLVFFVHRRNRLRTNLNALFLSEP